MAESSGIRIVKAIGEELARRKQVGLPKPTKSEIAEVTYHATHGGRVKPKTKAPSVSKPVEQKLLPTPSGLSEPLRKVLALAESQADQKATELVKQSEKQKTRMHKDVAIALIQSATRRDRPLPGYEQTGIPSRAVMRLATSKGYRTSPTAIESATKQIMLTRAKTKNIGDIYKRNQFISEHPDVEIPTSPYGAYDRVTVGTPMYNEAGQVVPGYQFSYSPKAKHKIRIAESTENYDKYLSIVRNHPELAALHTFAGPLNIDLALASNKPGITGASEREEILIKQLHAWKGSPEGGPDIGRGAMAVIENPFVQIALGKAGGMAIGKLTGSASGYLAARYGPRAVQAFNLAQLAAGGALVGPQAYSIGKKAYEGKTAEAIGDITMFGLTFAAGIEGYRLGKGTPKLFGKSKGLTPYEAGYKKGLVKSKRFDPLQKEYYNIVSEIKQDLRLRHVMPVQEEPTYTNVRALEQYNKQKADILRNVIKNQLISLKNRAQISGGAGTEKPSTGDIDELFRSAKDPVILKYIARKLGIDPNVVFDPHQLPRTGQIITRGGAPKEPPYPYPSGQRGIRFTEQFGRLADSSMELAHKGRIKDISEAVRMLDLVYKKSGGIPKNIQPKVQRFLELSAILEQDPRIMDPSMSRLLYDSGIGKKLWSVRTKFYQKVLPETYLAKQFQALSKSDLATLQNYLSIRSGGGLPPSLSMAFSDPSYGVGSWVAFFSGLSRSHKRPPSTLPSTLIGDTTSPKYPSESKFYPSYPPKPPSPKKSKPSKSVSEPPSAYPSKMSKSPYSKPPYYPPGYPYPLIPSSPSSEYPYYPYPSSPISEVITPPEGMILFPPGFAGKIAGKGKAEPYSVKYFNEYEAIQDLLRNVIF